MNEDELLGALRRALQDELRRGVQVLRYLAEVDRRDLYVDRGYSSLFSFCVEALGLTEDQACRRIRAVRAAAKAPEVLPLLESGELHLTGVSRLSKYMNEDNAHQLIERARNKSKKEVEAIIAEEFPGANSTDDRVVAATPETFAFHFDGSAEAKALLDRAKQLTPPGTDIGEIFEEALALYVAKLEKRKNGKTDRPRSAPPSDAPAGARYVPAATKRAVHERDGGQCTFVSRDGKRCTERANLEYDHVCGSALGGKSTVDEVRLLCRTHNLHAARELYGAKFIDRKIRKHRSTLTGQGESRTRPEPWPATSQ